jgi:shikimate dehydrogenase
MTNLSQQAPGWDRRDAPVSILGAGGAARAIVFGFLDAGVSEIRVFNRTRARAETLAQQFGSCVKVFDWSQREAGSRDSAVLVNTTTIGMNGAGTLDLDLAGFDPECVVSDIVYVPLETELLRKAKSQGLRTVDGLGMLLHQGVPGFEKWFGVRPEVTDELRNLIVGDIEGG